MMSKVSAIVSAYNSERFLRGCIDDLLNQTLYAQNRLEIIVINASEQRGDTLILRDYLRQSIPLQIITTPREPLYTSWNRGIRLATGDYITNANTDDRHRPDALEMLADTLDSQPSVGVVYADCYVTNTENAVWDKPYTIVQEAPYGTGRLNWPTFDRQRLTQQCYIGPQPLWRRSLHQQFGLFDESYMVAGDYEFWLRLAAYGVEFQRVAEVLGLFYWNPNQLGRAQSQQSAMESRRALLKWRSQIDQLAG
jgi:glycosyltransferase involved in cell wall biosynthesis